MNFVAFFRPILLCTLFGTLISCRFKPEPDVQATPFELETAAAGPTEPPDNILFIGNSLSSQNLGIHAHIKELAASANPPLTIETAIKSSSGTPLKVNWDRTNSTIREGTWDVVVLQELPLNLPTEEQDYEDFYEIVRQFDEEIKKVGAQTVLFMTWEYIPQYGAKEPTIEEIAQTYGHIGKEPNISVAPIGLAWQRSIQERPNLELLETDGLHPNVRGTYLAVCVLYATIFGESPVGLAYQPADLIANVESLEWKQEKWQMTEDEVTFLQRIAWETVVAYHGDD